jgi:predicted amidohydrolase
VFETRFGRIALLICQDANYVETFRLAALGGADVVCFSTNSSGQTIGHLQARAIQNGVYIVSANRSDTEVERYNGKPFEMKGCSAVWSPQGKKLAEARIKGEAIVYAEIDPAAFHLRKVRLSQRRPETYKALARHVAPWNLRATKKPRRIEAVAVQYLPTPAAVQENCQLIEQLLEERLGSTRNSAPVKNGKSASPADGRLIVLPELSLIGRTTAEKTRALAEPFDEGPTYRWAAALARRYESFVVCGLAERDGEQLFNAAIVVNPKGERIGHARKVHLNRDDRAWAAAGDGWTVVHAEQLGRLGILVGNDSYVPEAGTVMAIQRADVVAVSADWHGEIAGDEGIAINDDINPHAKQKAMVLWDEMSWGHQFFTVVANSAASDVGPGGRSGVYSTDPIYGIASTTFAATDEREVVVGRFQTLNGAHPEHWIDQHHYIGSRRPDSLYYPLLEPLPLRRAPRQEQAPLQVAP